MPTDKERRFIRYWEDQRTGGKWSYILTYTLCLGVIFFFLPVTAFYIFSMLHFFSIYGWPVWLVIVLSLTISFAVSQYWWHRNEGKWKLLTGK